MAITNISKENIIEALKYIDEHDVPPQNQSTQYDLVTDDGKKYPPKYVIAVANYLANGGEKISTDKFNAEEARSFLQQLGFNIEKKQFELTITADDITSTDTRFNKNDLSLGDNYKAQDTFFKKADGEIIRREYNKGEQKVSNEVMPRLACQIFEKELDALPIEEKKIFPICRYTPKNRLHCGIFPSREDYPKKDNRRATLVYKYDENKQFVIHSWNVFSTILFVQECLKRFGKPGEKMVLLYTEKDKKEKMEDDTEDSEALAESASKGYKKYSRMLLKSSNIIFHGAPGTGKTHLAKKIAADIISNGNCDNIDDLSPEQLLQFDFVQFHPNYDYSDFVEGLRPKLKDDGTSIGFELRDGTFKKLVDRARKNYENSKKSQETLEMEASVRNTIDDFLNDEKLGEQKFSTINGNNFTITDQDEEYIYISIPNNPKFNELELSIDAIMKLLASGTTFTKVKDITAFFGKTRQTQHDSYYFAIYKYIKSRKKTFSHPNTQKEELKKYVFVIDEINRGEISKIFGELFFAIDPGYRGEKGKVKTQYASMHSNPEEKFYIPENVYVIGTMNDIDRSVDSFDFAMRRRFRFVELKVDECIGMLDDLEEEKKKDAIERMNKLNKAIVNVDELNENYQIAPAYFLKLKTLSPNQLWDDYLEPLLHEYVHGMNNEDDIMRSFAEAYGYTYNEKDDVNEEANENQG